MAQARTRKKIVIKGNDYDGCLGWVALLTSPYFQTRHEIVRPDGQKLPKEINNEILKSFLVNSGYGKKIKEQFNDPSIEEIILTSSSSRQNLELDLFARITHMLEPGGDGDSGSAFLFLDTLSEFLEEELKSKKIKKDQRTFDDIWNKKDLGSAYKHIASEYKRLGLDSGNFTENLQGLKDQYSKLLESKEPPLVFDNEKITLLYAQIHSFAKEHKDDDILFEFYDDRENICGALHYAFSNFPQLLPKNVQFKIYHYDLFHDDIDELISRIQKNPLDENCYALIKGTGSIDESYSDHIKELHAIFLKHLGKSPHADKAKIKNILEEYLAVVIQKNTSLQQYSLTKDFTVNNNKNKKPENEEITKLALQPH